MKIKLKRIMTYVKYRRSNFIFFELVFENKLWAPKSSFFYPPFFWQKNVSVVGVRWHFGRFPPIMVRKINLQMKNTFRVKWTQKQNDTEWSPRKCSMGRLLETKSKFILDSFWNKCTSVRLLFFTLLLRPLAVPKRLSRRTPRAPCVCRYVFGTERTRWRTYALSLSLYLCRTLAHHVFALVASFFGFVSPCVCICLIFCLPLSHILFFCLCVTARSCAPSFWVHGSVRIKTKAGECIRRCPA